MRYTKRQRMIDFYRRFEGLGFDVDAADALRRIEMTLHRWAEAECNGDIERDEDTGKIYRSYAAMGGKHFAYRIADREAGALKRLGAIMAQHPEFLAYHQGDPRGCALYIVRKTDIPEGGDIDAYYTRGFAVCYA
jgi:hypothetical protein